MSQERAAEAPPAGVDGPVPPGAWVRVLRGFYEGLELPVDRAWWVIGRGRGADAVLAEPTISRAHVAIGYLAGDGFFIQDLGSTNGTLLNGSKTQRATLSDGDELQMGKLRLRVGIPGAPS